MLKMFGAGFGCCVLLAFASPAVADAVDVVDRPRTTSTNAFYTGNRAPLEPSRFIALPPGAVRTRGWLRELLERQCDGLCGHLDEISGWLQTRDNAWLSRDGSGKFGWEEVPYWLRGYIQLAYALDEPELEEESRLWIRAALDSQRPDGDFGPNQKFDDDGSRDFWPNMLMLYCLETYYEHTQDARVLDLMTKYFKFQLSVPDDKFLTHYWQHMRGGDNLHSVIWLYNRTGDAFLLDLAAKIHRRTANWEMKDTLPDWHNVNIAEGFREPAIHYQLTHDAAELRATYADFNEVRNRYGQVPGGMFGGDENCRPGYTDPRQAVETCGMVEELLSDLQLTEITGDAFWADESENVAFNTYPAAVTEDFRALRYLTAPNMVLSDDKDHSPGVQNGGPFLMMNPFSSRCCQHNHGIGWPSFARHLWLATPDNGLCAAVYSASVVQAKVGDGSEVRFAEETRYPFDDRIRFSVSAEKPATFPLYLRVPGWCDAAEVSVNGKRLAIALAPGKFVRIEREWRNKDTVALRLPMKISLRQWTRNHNSVSVDYGPLTFALKIGEHYERRDSSKTAISDSSWQKSADPSKWPAFVIYPITAWNYGLALDRKRPEESFSIRKRAWPKDNFPFSPQSCPIELETKARQIPQWTLDKYGLCGVLQDSPAWTQEPATKVTLIPMGAARLRISSFPTVTPDGSACHWTPTPTK